LLAMLLSVSFISVISAACTDTKPVDYCFGAKVYTHQCNETIWSPKLKGDCAILGQICKSATCVDAEMCKTNSDCDDSNPCTDDQCVGETEKRCENNLKQGCEFNSQCIPIGSRITEDKTSKFCSITNELTEQKSTLERCDNDYECETNSCISGKCNRQSRTDLIIFTLIIALLLIELSKFFRRKRR